MAGYFLDRPLMLAFNGSHLEWNFMQLDLHKLKLKPVYIYCIYSTKICHILQKDWLFFRFHLKLGVLYSDRRFCTFFLELMAEARVMDQMSSGDSSSDSQSSSSSSSEDSSSSSDSDDETRPSSGRSHSVPMSTLSMPIVTSQERSEEGSGHLMNTLSKDFRLFIYSVGLLSL